MPDARFTSSRQSRARRRGGLAGPDALLVGSGAFFIRRRLQLAHLATHHGPPAKYAEREYVEVGGLMSYGPNIADAFRPTPMVRRVLSQEAGGSFGRASTLQYALNKMWGNGDCLRLQ